ncbi:glycosyltransferase family 2 protein [Microbacterium sp. B2969]|uniref:Glycosyltransferase family 2 protein n=1 Tax=Microbacterium alkaliflavum TaxID=3248839 RepID=A0ABW7QA43_9MICO
MLDWGFSGGQGMIDFAIIVVSYHSAADLPGLVRSIDAATEGASWRLIVVDNAGESLSVIEAIDDRVSVIDAGGNLGYSGGLNVGIAHAPAARWIVFLNPDLELLPGSLTSLAAAVPPGAAAVPAIVDENDVRQNSLRREPSIPRALGEALFGDRWPARPTFLSEGVREADAYASAHDVDWATGAALLVDASTVAAVGPWDQSRFFMYSEETDYARRIRRSGSAIVYVPEAVVRHRGAGSGTSAALDALQEVNKIRYFRKWHHPAASSVFGGVILLRNLVRPHRPGGRAAVRAILSRKARAALPGGDR